MPLPSKVKRRICLIAAALLACVGAGVIIANDAAKGASRSIGKRAVTPPSPPVITPPILDKSTPRNTSLRIDLKAQRLVMLVAGEVAIDSPASSGRKDLETPEGKFEIGAKLGTQKQDAYGNFISQDGKVVVAGVYRDRDPVPSDLRFQAVTLQHVLAVKDQKFRLHAGAVGSLPVSDGSVILPAEIAKVLFSRISTGCPIEIIAE